MTQEYFHSWESQIRGLILAPASGYWLSGCSRWNTGVELEWPESSEDNQKQVRSMRERGVRKREARKGRMGPTEKQQGYKRQKHQTDPKNWSHVKK